MCHAACVPWVRALLRGQKVYARADEAGRLRVEGGRVEVRYKPHDGRRYGARADNLTVVEAQPLPDETCSDAVTPEQAAKGAPSGAPASGPASSGASSKPRSKRARAPSSEEPAPPTLAGGPAPRQAPRALHRAPDGGVIAYADGACSGNPGPAGLGVVLVDGPKRVELSEYLGDDLTNNIAELTAILRALENVDDANRPLWIHTDSQYSIGVLSKGWKAKANVDLIAEVKEALHARSRVRLIYVPGHSGVLLNERADALARRAVKERSSSRDEWTSRRPAEGGDNGTVVPPLGPPSAGESGGEEAG